MKNEIKVGEYISKKEFLKRNNSIVAYALHVSSNIKKDDYARLNTGDIVKVSYIKENNCVKNAIYYGIYDTDWFDCSAVENFSNNVIDLIETKDIIKINDEKYEVIYDESYEKLGILIPNKEQLAVRHCSLEYIFSRQGIEEFKEIQIVTHEQFEQICYRVIQEEN